MASTLKGNFKRIVRDAMNPATWNRESCPPPKDHRGDFTEQANKEYRGEDFCCTKDFRRALEEDEKLDYLLRMKHNLTEYFENSVHSNPWGMTGHDYKMISRNRKHCLEEYKMKVRREDYVYLSSHPEIDAMIELFLKKLMTEIPTDPIRFMAEFFAVKYTTYEEHMKAVETEREKILRFRKSKSKEFSYPKPEPVTTIRKLNLGPMAELLEFTKTEQKENKKESWMGNAGESSRNEKTKEERTDKRLSKDERKSETSKKSQG